MERPPSSPEQNLESNVIVCKPINELLQSPAEVAGLWSEERIAEQVQQHAVDIGIVESVLTDLPSPTTPLQEAVEGGDVKSSQAEDLYETLSRLLTDPEYARLALYLPFELIPDASWVPEDPPLRESVTRFTTSYMQAWSSLLHVHDVRANFVDGDVLEETHRNGDLPRVVKAAHLIPELINHGLISENEARQLRKTPDPVLKQSVQEALDDFYGRIPRQSTPGEPEQSATPGRKEWLKHQRRQEFISETADQVAAALLHEENTQQLDPLWKRTDPVIATQAFAEGVFQAVSQADQATAQRILSLKRSPLEYLLQSDNVDVQDRVTSVLRRLHRTGNLPHGELTRLGIPLPSLSGPFSENLTEIAPDVAFLKETTRFIETDPRLNSAVYPVVVVGGSKLKGYGGLNSDVDVSVFIKPGTPHAAMISLREELATLFVRDGKSYDPIEFWLDEPGTDRLKVHNFSNFDMHVADDLWTHILFNNAWIGNRQAITELQQKLLPVYFHATPETLDGVNKRHLYLERLEQDALQYRLLHKGYERHYPLIKTGKTLDGSVFWDPGYRQLATKLFVSHVFLPKV